MNYMKELEPPAKDSNLSKFFYYFDAFPELSFIEQLELVLKEVDQNEREAVFNEISEILDGGYSDKSVNRYLSRAGFPWYYNGSHRNSLKLVKLALQNCWKIGPACQEWKSDKESFGKFWDDTSKIRSEILSYWNLMEAEEAGTSETKWATYPKLRDAVSSYSGLMKVYRLLEYALDLGDRYSHSEFLEAFEIIKKEHNDLANSFKEAMSLISKTKDVR